MPTEKTNKNFVTWPKVNSHRGEATTVSRDLRAPGDSFLAPPTLPETMSMSPMFPLYALSLPTLLIASAAISLHQFKLCFVAFVKLANTSRGNAVWQFVQPFLRDIAVVLEGTLGKASGFSPNLTHVMLTSLVLAVVFSAERVRGAILQRK